MEPFSVLLNRNDTHILLGKLVLEELKSIRREIKKEFKSLYAILLQILKKISSLDSNNDHKKNVINRSLCKVITNINGYTTRDYSVAIQTYGNFFFESEKQDSEKSANESFENIKRAIKNSDFSSGDLSNSKECKVDACVHNKPNMACCNNMIDLDHCKSEKNSIPSLKKENQKYKNKSTKIARMTYADLNLLFKNICSLQCPADTNEFNLKIDLSDNTLAISDQSIVNKKVFDILTKENEAFFNEDCNIIEVLTRKLNVFLSSIFSNKYAISGYNVIVSKKIQKLEDEQRKLEKVVVSSSKSFNQQNNDYETEIFMKRNNRSKGIAKSCKQVLCKICGEFKTNIHTHMRTHTGERPYKCLKCNKSFVDSGKLKKHSKIHTNERAYCCRICEKTFNSAESLRKHMLMHSSKKPHKCQYCDKSFTRKWLLKHHLYLHTGERPFHCSKCNKAFSRKWYLKQHMRTHENPEKRLFLCVHCQKRFYNNFDLIRHLRVHTNEKPFECPQCSKSFKLKGTLKTHLKTH